MRTSVGFNNATTAVASPAGTAHSAWHSPVPYLFGGLAAMLGLIAFALLILACSYWKLSGLLESGGGGGDSEAEASKPDEPEGKPASVKYEARVVVIMAGEQKPRYLATPILPVRTPSFGSCDSSSSSSSSSDTTTMTRRSSSEDDGEVHEKKPENVVIELPGVLRCDDQNNPEQNSEQ